MDKPYMPGNLVADENLLEFYLADFKNVVKRVKIDGTSLWIDATDEDIRKMFEIAHTDLWYNDLIDHTGPKLFFVLPKAERPAHLKPEHIKAMNQYYHRDTEEVAQ